MQAAADPTSLENLHDIVASLPVSLWWPPAPGWWILLAVFVGIGLWVAFRMWKAWRMNAYRRVALKELAELDDINRLPVLLKRVALMAYPRDVVAPLSGERWIVFLNESASAAFFEDTTGKLLSSLSYAADSIPENKKNELLDAARKWILMHGIRLEDRNGE